MRLPVVLHKSVQGAIDSMHPIMTHVHVGGKARQGHSADANLIRIPVGETKTILE